MSTQLHGTWRWIKQVNRDGSRLFADLANSHA